MRSPQQQIFDTIFSESLKLGYATFDYLPPSSQTLPFVYIGDQFDQDRRTKGLLYGDVQQTLHVYGDYRKRRQVTDMVDGLKAAIRKIKHTDNFYIKINNITSQMITDDSTSQRLWHGIIEVDLTFY